MARSVAIMQPYFLPYIGYWQLMDCVDQFVVYDNIEYTKKGWINRNRYLMNGAAELFSLPLRKASDHLCVNQRYLADDAGKEFSKILRKIECAYRSAPYFPQAFGLLEKCFLFEERNLFKFLYNSICIVRKELGIETDLVISSSVDSPEALRGQERVLSICAALGADVYINPIGGLELYDALEFSDAGIDLKFHRANDFCYKQNFDGFVDRLSILDVLMFNGTTMTKQFLKKMSLV